MKRSAGNRFFVGLLTAFLVVASASFIYSQNVKPEITAALESGDTALAIQLLDKDIEFDKSNPWNYYTKGMIYYNEGKYKLAAEQFETALDKKSKHFESLYQLGMCYLNLGRLDEAEEVMNEGIKKDKKDRHRFEDGHGLVLLAKGQYREADKDFRQALVGDSLNTLYHIHLGDANFYQGVPALAIIEYEKALAMDTAGLEVYYHWAEACLEMKDYSCAIEKLRVVLSKDSTHAPSWMRAGGIYFKAGLSSRDRQDRADRFKDAIGSYRKYLELSKAQPDSSNVRVFFELAMAYSNLNGFEDASEYYDKVLSIPYEPKDIYFQYGKSLWYNKDYERAAEMLLKHLDWVAKQDETYQSGVDMAEVYQFLGDSYYYRKPKDFSGAVTYYKKSVDLNPNQERIIQNLAVSYHNLKSYVQALKYYDMRIEMGIDSASAAIYKNAGYCAMTYANTGGEEEEDLGDEGMGEESEEVVDNPVDPDIDYYALAVDYLKKYIQFDPTDVRVIQAIASTYLYQLADCANGVQYFEKVLAVEPNNCEALKSLGYAYFGGLCTKNYSKALGYLLKAQDCIKASSGECADPALILWIAQAYHLRAVEKTEQKESGSDDFKAANGWYKTCLKCDPGNKDCQDGVSQTEYEF